MKHLKFYLLFLFSAVLPLSHANAQEHEEYYPQGTTWEEEKFYVTDDGRLFAEYRKYKVDGVTTFNGKIYKTIKVTYSNLLDERTYFNPMDTWNWVEQPKILFREQGDSIFYTRWRKNHEALRYDFNWSIGKKIPTYYDWWSREYQYEEIKDIHQVVLYDGQMYDCIGYHTLTDSVSFKLYQIKGVGFVDNFRGIFDVPGGYSFSLKFLDYKVRIFIRNGKIIYKWDRDVDKILGIDKVENDDGQKCGKTYTAYGTEVDASDMQSLPRGIYIRNGKKFVVK